MNAHGGPLHRLVRHNPGLSLVAAPCAALLIVAGFVWFPGASLPSEGHRPAAVGAAPVPQDRPAPEFELPRLARTGQLTLNSLRGDVVVLNFWAPWCAACQHEVPALEHLSRRYNGGDVDFLGVDDGDGRQAARAFAQRTGMTYPSVVDRSGTLLGKFGAAGLPATFIIGRDGRIRYEAIGTVDVAALGRTVDRVRSGHPAPVSASAGAPVHLAALDGAPASGFTLIDQFGRRTSLSDLRGHPVLLTFVDSRCQDVCSLTAQVLRRTLDLLAGDAASDVRLLAVNANPRHFSVTAVRTWSARHQMLHRWRYVTGQPAQLRRVWASYGVSSHYENGELEHTAVVYVLDHDLGERYVLSVSDLRTSVRAEAAALAKAVERLRRAD